MQRYLSWITDFASSKSINVNERVFLCQLCKSWRIGLQFPASFIPFAYCVWCPPKLSYPISGHRGALCKSSQSPFDLLYPVQWSKMTFKLCAKVNKLKKKILVTFNKSSVWESRSTEYEATSSSKKKKQVSSTATVEMVKMNWIRISFQSIVGGPSLVGVGRGSSLNKVLTGISRWG